MANKIYYKDSVGRDLKGIDYSERIRIIAKIERTLSENSDAGKNLRNSERRSLRIGNYRVIYTKVKDGVLIARIGHRKEVYRDI
ncbi:MAG: type II toxin-antitoxin system RelE/ParE family toxin [Endomicrobiia bacterium]|nr:type II toxin-antitoxin system RelE/ParE family toxin [Endomicrobiia bacterium]